jgi:hypothetical protein
VKNQKRQPGDLKLPPQKMIDEQLLRNLSVILRALHKAYDDIPQMEMEMYADAVDRHLKGYPPRARHRPSQDERNFWMAVGYWIRCLQFKGKRTKTRISEDLVDEYAEQLGVSLEAVAIRNLRKQHPAAEYEAKTLIERARDPANDGADLYEVAFADACQHVKYAQAIQD